MMTTLELTAGAVRLCRIDDQRIVALDSWPVPAGADPIAVLAAVPLPPRLGRVGVLLAHDDLLVRTLVQPAAPLERQERLLRFELESVAAPADGESQGMNLAWQTVPGPAGDDDRRILALVVRQRLLARLRQALGDRATLGAVSHPGLGLYQSFLRQEPAHRGCAVLVDVGGQSVHIAVVLDGALAFLRTLHPGSDDLVAQVARARGLAETAAEELVRNLAAGSPEDLHDLVTSLAGGIAAQTTAAIRFARTQLGLTLEPTVCQLSGRGALVHGFAAALAKRLALPVAILNPFAGVIALLPDERLDAVAGLPGPWAPVLGAALHPEAWSLDALADEHRARVHHRQTLGALRWGAAAGIVLALAGAGLALGRAAAAAGQRNAIDEQQQQGQALAGRQQAATATRQQAAARLAWLDAEHRVPRATTELLAAINGIQDPLTCPVVLNRFALVRQGGVVRLELAGAATAGRVGADAALHTFHDALRKAFPLLTGSDLRPTAIHADKMEFLLTAVVAER